MRTVACVHHARHQSAGRARVHAALVGHARRGRAFIHSGADRRGASAPGPSL